MMAANPANPVDIANIANAGGATVDAPPDGTDPTADRRTANESATALVALADASSSSPSPSPTPPEPSDATTGTLSVAQVQPPPDAPRYVPPDEAAHAWIDHVERGGSVPDGPTFVALLRALAAPRVPHPPHPNPVAMASLASVPDVRLILVDTSDTRKFPHMLDTQNGRLTDEDAIWTQCKTKMTHVAVRLVDKNGNPAKGKDVCEGGLVLRLTLHKVSDFEEAMDDDCNPRPSEGLFRGRSGGVFEPEVILTEGRHEFRFQVLLLSSDIGGARMFVKVAPKDPQLALNPNLTVRTRSFISRARMPDETHQNRANRERQAVDDDAMQLLDAAITIAQRRAAAAAAPAAVTEPESRAESPPHQRPRLSPVPHQEA